MKEIMVLTLTIDELRGIVREEVEQALRLSTKKVWFSEIEAQEYTGFSKRTLYDARQDGLLKSFKVNRNTRYHRDDLDSWMRSKRG